MGVGSLAVQLQQLGGEMVHDVGRGRCGEEADGGAVAEEAQVAVVGDDEVRVSAPDGLVCRLAGTDIVDGADVAAVEAYARAGAEHVLPRGVNGRIVKGSGVREGIGQAALLNLSHADEETILICFFLGLELLPFNSLLPVARHGGEAKLGPKADAPPDALLSGDKVGESLAHKTEAGKVSHIGHGDVTENVHEQLIWQVGDWAWRWWGVFNDGRRPLNLQPRKAGDELFQSQRLGLFFGGGGSCRFV